MTEFYRRSAHYGPALLRLVCYSSLAALAAAKGELDHMDGTHWNWVQWLKFVIPIAIAGITPLVAFLDQTMSKASQSWKPGETI